MTSTRHILSRLQGYTKPLRPKTAPDEDASLPKGAMSFAMILLTGRVWCSSGCSAFQGQDTPNCCDYLKFLIHLGKYLEIKVEKKWGVHDLVFYSKKYMPENNGRWYTKLNQCLLNVFMQSCFIQTPCCLFTCRRSSSWVCKNNSVYIPGHV